MLLLERRKEEWISLRDKDGGIIAVILCTKIKREKVWIGIDAPGDVRIARGELEEGISTVRAEIAVQKAKRERND